MNFLFPLQNRKVSLLENFHLKEIGLPRFHILETTIKHASRKQGKEGKNKNAAHSN